MFPSLANAKKFLNSGDYPQDKLIYLGDFPVTVGGGVDASVAHGLPFIPLIWFQWSYTSDFAVAYENNTGNFPSGNPGYYFNLQVAGEANATNMIFRGNGTRAAGTIYVRVFAFQPSNSNVDLAFTASQGDDFVYNGDYNYMKLINADLRVVNGGATVPVDHNSGYYPHVLAWTETGGTISPVNLSWAGTNLNIEVTTSQIIMRNDGFSTNTVHFRIYVDE